MFEIMQTNHKPDRLGKRTRIKGRIRRRNCSDGISDSVRIVAEIDRVQLSTQACRPAKYNNCIRSKFGAVCRAGFVGCLGYDHKAPNRTFVESGSVGLDLNDLPVVCRTESKTVYRNRRVEPGTLILKCIRVCSEVHIVQGRTIPGSPAKIRYALKRVHASPSLNIPDHPPFR